MALCKDIKTRYEVIASYHKIMEITISWHYKTCNVTIVCYKDKTARDNGALYLETKSYYYGEDNFDFIPEQNITEQLYSKIKQESDFIDAIDC